MLARRVALQTYQLPPKHRQIRAEQQSLGVAELLVQPRHRRDQLEARLAPRQVVVQIAVDPAVFRIQLRRQAG